MKKFFGRTKKAYVTHWRREEGEIIYGIKWNVGKTGEGKMRMSVLAFKFGSKLSLGIY